MMKCLCHYYTLLHRNVFVCGLGIGMDRGDRRGLSHVSRISRRLAGEISGTPEGIRRIPRLCQGTKSQAHSFPSSHMTL